MDATAYPLSKIVLPKTSTATATGRAFKPRGASRWCTFDVTITAAATVSIQGRLLEAALGADGPVPFKNIVGAAPAQYPALTQSQLISVLCAEEMQIVVADNTGDVIVLALDY